mgnify:CR=1 FL=1
MEVEGGICEGTAGSILSYDQRYGILGGWFLGGSVAALAILLRAAGRVTAALRRGACAGRSMCRPPASAPLGPLGPLPLPLPLPLSLPPLLLLLCETDTFSDFVVGVLLLLMGLSPSLCGGLPLPLLPVLLLLLLV